MTPQFPCQVRNVGEVLAHLCRKRRWTRGVWVGAGDARVPSHVLSLRLTLHLTVVEPWAATQPGSMTTTDYAWQERAARTRLQAYARRLRIIKGVTADALARVEGETFDFVYLDAGQHLHSEIRAWSPQVAKHGWLIGNAMDRMGVRAAVEDGLPAYWIGPADTWFGPAHRT